MKISISVTRGLTIVALLGLMALAVLGFRAQEKDMESLRQSSREIIYWSTSQAEAELGRLLATLGRFASRDPAVSAQDVNERFDIFWSRVELFRQGDVGRRIQEYDRGENTVGALRELLLKNESAIVGLSHDDPPEQHIRILGEFASAGQKLRELSMRVLDGEEMRLAGARDNVRSSARLTWAFSMAALVLSLLLVGIMLIETRRYQRMARESAELADRAEAASQAKSRFLTMMSHELRTPMNGVLGLLALVRQTSLNERQVRLIDQAERSGRLMSGLLADILDYSDLQSETLVIAEEVFELRSLAQAVEDGVGPLVKHSGVGFRYDIEPGVPRWVRGDMARLRQVIGHIVTYLVETVGSDDVVLRIGRTPSGLRFDLDAAVGAGDRPGWQPEAMFGRGDAKYGNFASDSLGPMIARGVVTRMGGALSLARPREGRATLSITVPLRFVETARDCVRIDAGSASMQAMLAALLRRTPCAIWDAGVPTRDVTAILMEAGSEDEIARAARLRSDHPAAQLVAAGQPRNPELFDIICTQPLTAEGIQAAVAREPGVLQRGVS